MAALTDNRDTLEMQSAFSQLCGDFGGGALVDSDEFYVGQLVCFDQSDQTIKPAAASTTLIALGRAEERVTTGASNTETLRVRCGIFKYENSGSDAVAAADCGNTVYMEDDNTIAKTDATGTLSAAGILVKVESDGVYVAINPFA
jgi:hypothetical protein